MAQDEVIYDENNIRTLEWNKHIRLRPGMYIGKLGDGALPDDGIYVLIKEVIDNSVDEYVMGYGKTIDIKLNGSEISVRDYGRGIPLGKLLEAASVLNTGAKYDSKAFKKSVGLNGVGIKAVNALSSKFIVAATREGERRTIEFSGGEVVSDTSQSGLSDRNGTMVTFVADDTLFGDYNYKTEFIEGMLRNYTYLNTGLTMQFNGEKFVSKNGLLDLLNENIGQEALYPPIHLSGEDIEVALTHGTGYGESYYSFVNGQHTTQGGTHQAAFREAVVK
ncbi:MAG: ATP-binding protein, partial [Mucinivorans sp.]